MRVILLATLDTVIVLTSFYLSFILVNNGSTSVTQIVLTTSLIIVIFHHLFATIFKLYQKAWEYASIGELLSIFNVVTISIVLAGISQFIIYSEILFRHLIITWMLHMLLIGGSRFAWRVFRDTVINHGKKKKRTLIIGAGAAGEIVTRQLLNGQDSELKPVVFLDDAESRRKIQIHGIPVVGRINDVEKAVEKYRIEHIVIAIPSVSRRRLNEIVELCSLTGIKTQITPRLEDLFSGKLTVKQIRDVQVEDLLGREPVKLDNDSISGYLKNKTVLITGAGGSIGSEICRQVATFHPESIILVGHGENSIYEIDRQLRETYEDEIHIIPIIADIKDRKRIFEVIENYKPSVIYHAAAHKHVPLMEYNPQEAVKNNIYGTKNVADALMNSE